AEDDPRAVLILLLRRSRPASMRQTPRQQRHPTKHATAHSKANQPAQGSATAAVCLAIPIPRNLLLHKTSLVPKDTRFQPRKFPSISFEPDSSWNICALPVVLLNGRGVSCCWCLHS